MSYSDAYSLCTCHSRAPIFPGATVTAGARVNNRSNHTVGGVGDYSVEVGVNLETAGREGCSPLPISWFYLQAANVSAPSAAFTLTSFPDADRVSSVGELSLPSAACRKNPTLGRLMAQERAVLIKWNRLFSLRDTDIIKAS